MNVAHARHLEVRRLLLIGRLDEAERTLDGLDPAPFPPASRTAHELVVAGIAMRRLRTKAARAALARAGRAAQQAGIPALTAEVESAVRVLSLPAARLIASGEERDSTLSGICIHASRAKESMRVTAKNTVCLWYNKDALDAARFYAATFPDSAVTAVHEAPSDYPGGKKGEVLTVDFTVMGIPCLGLNGGPEFPHSEAFSFQVATEDQEETDRYWTAIVDNGGEESQCGWCRDRWGLSWQITPRVLIDALAAGGDEAKRAFEAMMPMRKIDVATIEAARRG